MGKARGNDALGKLLLEKVLVFDGAMGTEIYKRNFFVNTCFEELCLSAPKVISSIHDSYRDAGADVLTANSFGANRNKLSRFGLAEKTIEINTAAIRLARASGGPDAMIAGSVGPIGEIPYKSGMSQDAITEMLSEQIDALEKAGADFILFETTPKLADVERALKAISAGSRLPYVVSLSVSREGESAKGEPLPVLLKPILSMEDRRPTAIGLNCGLGPEGLLSALEHLIPLCDLPIIAQPNAGVPRDVDNRLMYMTSPEYFSTYALRFINLGVRGVGGCCGVGPDHIKDLARSVKPMTRKTFTGKLKLEADASLKEPVPTASKSSLGAMLAKKEWIKTVEILPPRGCDLEPIIEKAVSCRKAGVNAINIPDGPRASSRMSPIITSLFIQERAKIETILHFCCRDKNLIGMQADLLGCAAAGIHNLLFITGDPPKLGDYPYASAVFDADSIGMARIQKHLNRGVDLGGTAISPQTKALIGVGADPNALDFEREIRRTREKVEAGAEYIITQPVFDAASLFKFLKRIDDFRVPVIAGIWPLASLRNAEFMRNEVPGVVVPDAIMRRMAAAPTKEAQREEGIAIAREIVEALRSSVQGVQVSAPFGNVTTALAVLR